MLIDAGWARDGPRIEQAIRPVLGGVQPTAVLLTHCHPDHSGAAGELARRWGCPVWMHPKELPIATGDFAAMQAWAGPLDRWVILPTMSVIGRRRRETVLARGSPGDVARTFPPGATFPPFPAGSASRRRATPPGHVSYLRRSDRVLVSGDALCTLRIDSVRGLLLQRRGCQDRPGTRRGTRRRPRSRRRSSSGCNRRSSPAATASHSAAWPQPRRCVATTGSDADVIAPHGAGDCTLWDRASPRQPCMIAKRACSERGLGVADDSESPLFDGDS